MTHSTHFYDFMASEIYVWKRNRSLTNGDVLFLNNINILLKLLQ